MDKHLTEILLEMGYKTYRYASTFPDQNPTFKAETQKLLKRDDLHFFCGDKTSEVSGFYFPTPLSEGFSTMVVGGGCYFFVKDFDFDWDKMIIWGLSEYKKPPTLKSPRPRILVKKIVKGNITVYNEDHDDSMNLCLSKEPHSKILEAMYNPDIVFRYDLTI